MPCLLASVGRGQFNPVVGRIPTGIALKVPGIHIECIDIISQLLTDTYGFCGDVVARVDDTDFNVVIARGMILIPQRRYGSIGKSLSSREQPILIGLPLHH